jgi:hypothetical protein
MCRTCKQIFESRNLLFGHLQETNHYKDYDVLIDIYARSINGIEIYATNINGDKYLKPFNTWVEHYIAIGVMV